MKIEEEFQIIKFKKEDKRTWPKENLPIIFCDKYDQYLGHVEIGETYDGESCYFYIRHKDKDPVEFEISKWFYVPINTKYYRNNK